MSAAIKTKLLAASMLVLLLAAFAQRSGMSAALGVAAVAGLAWWMIRARRAGGSPARAGGFQLPPRLSIAARTGLSARCGLALVDADGQRYLVAYGDGFAQLLNAVPPRAPAQARTGRRPATRRPARKGGRS